tara:strand:- start:1906 stop:2250 length:345 start_codon:yes stop_codon:yes gene_type:complete
MAKEKMPFMEEEVMEEEISPEDEALELEGEGPDVAIDVDVEEVTDFASPTEALAAAIEEHGADAEALIAWFDEYGYELVKKGDEGMGIEEEPMELDLIAMRNQAASNAFPGEMA